MTPNPPCPSSSSARCSSSAPTASPWRASPAPRLIGRLGENGYKVAYSLLSLLGLILIGVGYDRYRESGYIPVWDPPVWTRHLALLLVWLAFVAFVAAYLPGRIKGALKHPMMVGIKVWALAHLLANGDLGSMLLFGSLLAWAVVARISVKRRSVAAAHGGPLAAPAGLPQRRARARHRHRGLSRLRDLAPPPADRRRGLAGAGLSSAATIRTMIDMRASPLGRLTRSEPSGRRARPRPLPALAVIRTPPSLAGPCTAEIAQAQAAVDARIEAIAGAGPTGSQSVGAQLHRQPTPGSMAQAEGRLGEGSVGERAVAALRAGAAGRCCRRRRTGAGRRWRRRGARSPPTAAGRRRLAGPGPRLAAARASDPAP